MISGTFKYSILQYIPSQVLNERVNVGILLFFPQKGGLNFLYPDSLSRLKGLYRHFKDNTLKAYLQQVEKNVAKINSDNNLFEQSLTDKSYLPVFIDTQILKSDDSALQFTDIKESVIYSSNYEKIRNDLYHQFFDEYITKSVEHHVTEEVLRNAFYKKIKDRNPNILNKFQEDVLIKAENNEFHFDFAWQNGSFNLVKPISFDLKESRKIQEKSVLIFGNLSLLSDLANDKNYKFDLLVAEPNNKEVFKSFDHALNTIDKASVKKEIILQSNIEAYAQKACDYLTSIA